MSRAEVTLTLPADVAHEVAEVLRDSIAVCGPGLFGELLLAVHRRQRGLDIFVAALTPPDPPCPLPSNVIRLWPRKASRR